jgi:hypothetical protein
MAGLGRDGAASGARTHSYLQIDALQEFLPLYPFESEVAHMGKAIVQTSISPNTRKGQELRFKAITKDSET